MKKAEIRRIVRELGGPTKIAKSLGVTVAAVSKWERIPPARARKLAELSGGRYTPQHFCPLVFGRAPTQP